MLNRYQVRWLLIFLPSKLILDLDKKKKSVSNLNLHSCKLKIIEIRSTFLNCSLKLQRETLSSHNLFLDSTLEKLETSNVSRQPGWAIFNGALLWAIRLKWGPEVLELLWKSALKSVLRQAAKWLLGNLDGWGSQRGLMPVGRAGRRFHKAALPLRPCSVGNSFVGAAMG